MSDDVKAPERKNIWLVISGRSGPIANAAISAVAGGLGAAAAIPSAPVVIPFAIASGLAGYFLTNRTHAD